MCPKKKAINRILDRALKDGLRLDDIKEKSKLYDYIKHKVKPGCIPIIYNNNIYILSDDNALVTVLNLPKKYIKIADKIKCKKEGKKYHDCRRRETAKGSPYDEWEI